MFPAGAWLRIYPALEKRNIFSIFFLGSYLTETRTVTKKTGAKETSLEFSSENVDRNEDISRISAEILHGSDVSRKAKKNIYLFFNPLNITRLYFDIFVSSYIALTISFSDLRTSYYAFNAKLL